MARAGLEWSIEQLSKAAGVRSATVSNFENGGDARESTKRAIKQALLESGRVQFDGSDTVTVISQ
jgi:transcriptional regulator with XRE-family HTH domain